MGPGSQAAGDDDQDLRGGYLNGLQAHLDHFQLEAFFKAATKAGKGFSLFRKKKDPKPGTPGSGTGSQKGEFTLDDLLMFQSEPIPTSLLKMGSDHMSRAVKMFSGILKYMGETNEPVADMARLEIAQKLLHQGLKRPELKDELFMQLIKQTRGNPGVQSRVRAWELFSLIAATMPPSKVCVCVNLPACA
jgi:hypothetical protein